MKRPPRDITPQTFFEDWLPKLFTDEFGAGRRAATDIRVRVRLEGEGGGAWDLALQGGTLRVEAPDAAEPQVTVMQTVTDWRAVTVGDESGTIDLAPPQASPLDVLFIDQVSRQVLQTVRGLIRFEVTGYRGGTWALTVKLGEQPPPVEPNATISVDAETYARLLARKLAPPEAFFQGKVKLAGDTALAMQLGMALMPRFT